MKYDQLNDEQLSDSELEDVCGGLLREIGRAMGAAVEALAGALSDGALKAGCLINPATGMTSSCPKNPPPV